MVFTWVTKNYLDSQHLQKKFNLNIGVLTFEPMPKMFFN